MAAQPSLQQQQQDGSFLTLRIKSSSTLQRTTTMEFLDLIQRRQDAYKVNATTKANPFNKMMRKASKARIRPAAREASFKKKSSKILTL